MKLIDLAVQTAQKAGRLIMRERKKGFKVDKKSARDLVTTVDKASEELIIREIKKYYPKHEFLGEEGQFEEEENLAELAKAKYIWIIDPIDGTTNFVHGLAQFAISIAVFKTKHTAKSKNYGYLEGELVAGVVYAPALKEMFYAEKGKGAFLNGDYIKVSKTKKLADAVAVTGFPYKDKAINLPYLVEMLQKCRGVRRFGAASLDLAYIAAGRFDTYWELGLNAWDIAAGALIVSEAGGKITDFNGETLDLFGKEILASNKKTHKETISLFDTI